MDIRALLVGPFLALWLVLPAFAQDAAGEAAIRHLMMATFDRPDDRLLVEPISMSGDVAIAGCAQGGRGGRALLRRSGDHWKIVLCAGDTLKDAAALQTFGLPAEQAAALASAVVAAEGKLDPALVAKFSTFDGVMMIEDGGHHPPVEGHGTAGQNG